MGIKLTPPADFNILFTKPQHQCRLPFYTPSVSIDSKVRPRVSGSVARTTKNAPHTTHTYSTHTRVAPKHSTSGMNVL